MEMASKEQQSLLGGCDMISLQVTIYCKVLMQTYKPCAFLCIDPNNAVVNEC